MAAPSNDAGLFSNASNSNKRVKKDDDSDVTQDTSERESFFCLMPTELIREISAYSRVTVAVRFSLASKTIRHAIRTSFRVMLPPCDEFIRLDNVIMRQFAGFQSVSLLLLGRRPPKRNPRDQRTVVSEFIDAVLKSGTPLQEIRITEKGNVKFNNAPTSTWKRNLSQVRVLVYQRGFIPPVLLNPCLTKALRVLHITGIPEKKTCREFAFELVEKCPNLQCFSLRLVPYVVEHEWLEMVTILSSLKHLFFTYTFSESLTSATVDQLNKLKLSFVAHIRNNFLFQQHIDVAFGMLERAVQKYQTVKGSDGIVPLTELFVPEVLEYVNTPDLVSRLLQAGFNASTLLEIRGDFQHHWILIPAWLFFIVHATDPLEMTEFMFQSKATSSGLSVIGNIMAEYGGCLPALLNIWNAIIVVFQDYTRSEKRFQGLPMLVSQLLDLGALPEEEHVSKFLQASSRNFNGSLLRALIMHPACPLPEISGDINFSSPVQDAIFNFVTKPDPAADTPLTIQRREQMKYWLLKLEGEKCNFQGDLGAMILDLLEKAASDEEPEHRDRKLLAALLRWCKRQTTSANVYTLQHDEIVLRVLTNLSPESVVELDQMLLAAKCCPFFIYLVFQGLPRCAKTWIKLCGVDYVNAQVQQLLKAPRPWFCPVSVYAPLSVICGDTIRDVEKMGISSEPLLKFANPTNKKRHHFSR